MATVVALEVADLPSVWTDLGFAVDGGACQVGSVRIDLVGADGAGGAGEREGVVSWTLSGVELDDDGRLDGRMSPAKEAVQSGRRIATLVRDAGSRVAIAFTKPGPPTTSGFSPTNFVMGRGRIDGEGRHQPLLGDGQGDVAGVPGLPAVVGALVLGDPATGLGRGRGGPPERGAGLVPLRLAVGRLGIAPDGGRYRSGETFLIEEIIDPRDTRPLLCEFANLAVPLRTAGPTARGYRP